MAEKLSHLQGNRTKIAKGQKSNLEVYIKRRTSYPKCIGSEEKQAL